MSRTAATPPAPDPASLRVFFALWPDARARDALAVLAGAAAARAQGRAAAAANLHLTLAFLGDVPSPRVASLQSIGAAAASAVRPFALTLDRVGAFREAGIAWAGASAVPVELERLAALLHDALAAQNVAIERRAFRPHITLARRCRKRVSASVVTPITWTVTRMTLNASDLSSGVPRYHEVAGWPLGPLAA